MAVIPMGSHAVSPAPSGKMIGEILFQGEREWEGEWPFPWHSLYLDNIRVVKGFIRNSMALADYIGKFWTGAEVMYGVIIAMTFTSVLRGYPAVLDFVLTKVVFAALFCCIAWGIADGLFYFWERGYIIRRENRIIRFSRSAQDNESALSLIGEELDDTVLRNIPPENRLQLYQTLVQFLSGVDAREKVSLHEAMTIITGTFILSAGAGLIVVVPFFVIRDVDQALILSNVLGILLLFGVGYFRAFDRSVLPRVLYGIVSSLIGIFIAGITVVLGG
ncbi:MAG: hypothetical protein GKC05_07925 [Methanomicrobiales archaeon]|nr:hypothetical protein [Methanomicrobiales archaeon]NYT21435.1 hypothetical protein [Methanomicrobiales archaeon]